MFDLQGGGMQGDEGSRKRACFTLRHKYANKINASALLAERREIRHPCLAISFPAVLDPDATTKNLFWHITIGP